MAVIFSLRSQYQLQKGEFINLKDGLVSQSVSSSVSQTFNSVNAEATFPVTTAWFLQTVFAKHKGLDLLSSKQVPGVQTPKRVQRILSVTEEGIWQSVDANIFNLEFQAAPILCQEMLRNISA